MHELVMSHVDEIFHVWMCPITYWWVVANMNESCHMWITSEYVLSCVSHVIYEWPRISLVMCVNVSWHIGMSCIDGSCNIFIRHITCSWGISRVNKSCYMWIRHVTYEWGMSHVIEAYGIMMMISFTIILGEIIQWLCLELSVLLLSSFTYRMVLFALFVLSQVIKTENIHANLALLIWIPTLLCPSTPVTP